MKVDFTTDELIMIASAINREVASASRAQKTGKTPHIIEVYKLHEAALKSLEGKCLQYANAKVT